MKSLSQMNNATINQTQMNNIKGGTGTTVVIDTMVEITTSNCDATTGGSSVLYCDRRRKKVNA